VPRRRHLGWRCRGGKGRADVDGRRPRRRARARDADPPDVQHRHPPHGASRRRPRDEGAEQLPERRQPRRDRGGDGRGEARWTRPPQVPRRREHLERRQLRNAQPLPADRRRRLPRRGADEQAHGEGHPALPRVPAGDLRDEPQRPRVSRCLQSRDRARLRGSDLEPRRRRDRRCRRRSPAVPMRVARGRDGTATEERGPTFTGRVWADPLLPAEDGIVVNNVFFEPGARTHWHTHEVAQVLYVLAGEGRAQSRDGGGWALTAGDTVHIPAGEEHWHGAAPGSYLLHLAVSVGRTSWLEPVADHDYRSSFATG